MIIVSLFHEHNNLHDHLVFNSSGNMGRGRSINYLIHCLQVIFLFMIYNHIHFSWLCFTSYTANDNIYLELESFFHQGGSQTLSGNFHYFFIFLTLPYNDNSYSLFREHLLDNQDDQIKRLCIDLLIKLYSIFAPRSFDRNSKTETDDWQTVGSEADFIAAGYTLQRLSEV